MDVLILFFHLIIGHCAGNYVLQLGPYEFSQEPEQHHP